MKKIFGILMITLALVTQVSAQGFGNKQLFNDNWHFNLGDIQYGGRENMDCSKWKTVELPHDWSVEQTASPELASCTGYLPGGIGWYRKDFKVPVVEKGKKVYIYFGGVYNNSEVFINGKWIGKRPNGYISFMYDLSAYIKWGENNSIAVRVDHSADADSRWYTGSGIYRDVYLVYANPVHINLWGVSYQAEVTKSEAAININTSIQNTTNTITPIKVSQQLVDDMGHVVASITTSDKALGATNTSVSQKIKLRSPKRWSIDSPYLYTLNTQVYQGDKVIDKNTCKVGFRDIKFDANKGFFLNNENLKLKGVCIHHDAGVLGAAVPKSVWRYRLEQLKSIGCNAIRTSHNPQASCLYELCDELGFVVMDEAFDEWEYPKNKWITGWNHGVPGQQGTSAYFREWGTRDLKDMVLRDRNHPSVIMWSIGNEVDYPNDPYSHSILDSEGIGQIHVSGFKTERPHAERLGDIAKELVTAVKEADTSRPVTAALAGAVMSNYTDYPFVLDIVGYNYTESRYQIDHQKYPERVLYGSENRHDVSSWYAVKNNDFIAGQFLWTGFDYLGESGRWPSRGFTTGLIDLTGQVKPRGYFRKSLWDDAPMAYIGTYQSKRNRLSADAPQIWNYDEGAEVRVVCYTNCQKAELKLNGKVIGEMKSYDKKTGIIFWDVAYKYGVLEVLGYNKDQEAASHQIISNTMPQAITAKVLPVKDETLHRQLIVSIVDQNGNQVALADNEISCSVSGGKILGLENASADASENYQDNKHRCKNGRLLVHLQKDGDAALSLKLSTPLLKSVIIDVK